MTVVMIISTLSRFEIFRGDVATIIARTTTFFWIAPTIFLIEWKFLNRYDSIDDHPDVFDRIVAPIAGPIVFISRSLLCVAICVVFSAISFMAPIAICYFFML